MPTNSTEDEFLRYPCLISHHGKHVVDLGQVVIYLRDSRKNLSRGGIYILGSCIRARLNRRDNPGGIIRLWGHCGGSFMEQFL